ncbi:hypothetical protein [Antiquaquibacter soli]|uniref:O-antigen ligase family protein n=1 Tax=Antiquaquibacter soli TaxID=3064523 RepID=A0ABT9BP05_9MICO|nr:hypothetical protein [Protaetiibacter sp. WY-16]MDO7881022.1 hypothetical protein [Protaetiibacter sp. WY-16]
MTDLLAAASTWVERRSRPLAAGLAGLAVLGAGAAWALRGLLEAIAVLVVVGGIALALVAPLLAWCLFVAFALSGGIPLSIGPVDARLELLGIPMLLVALWRWRAGRAQPLSRWIVASAALWLGLGLVSSVLVAPEPLRSVWIWVQQLGGILIVWAVARTEPRRRILFSAASATIGALALAALVLYLIAPGAQPGATSDDVRLSGLALEPNLYAAMCVGWLAVSYYLRAWRAPWHWAVDAVLVVSVVLAGTRAAWIAAVVLAVFVAATALRSRGLGAGRTALVLVGAGAVLGGAMFAVLAAIGSASDLVNRALTLLDFSGGTGAYRLTIYQQALAELAEPWRWVIGSGANSFSQFHPVDPTNVGAAYLSTVWLAVPYDAGVLGAVGFVALLVLLWLSTVRRAESLAVFAVVLICASATNSFWLAFPWLFFGLVVDRGMLRHRPTAPDEHPAPAAHA